MPTPKSHDGSIIKTLLQHPRMLLLGIAFLSFSYILFRVVTDPLRKVPGPFWARFTRLWELKKLREGHFEQVNIDLHKQYGPVVRLGPGRYSINDRVATKQIYGHGSKFLKSDFYVPFGDAHEKNLFSETDIHKHGQDRRQLAALYTMSTVVSYEQFVDKSTEVLMSKLSLFAEKQQSMSVPTWMQFYAFDVIGEITVGKSFGMMERGYDDIGILEALDVGTIYSTQVGVAAPEWHSRIAWLGAKLGQPNPIQVVIDFTQDRIAERRVGKTSSDRADYLSKLLTLYEKGSIDAFALQNGIGANVVAGSDTTAVTLSAVVYYLLKNPRVLAKLRQEIAEFEREGKISDPIKFSEAQRMPYLQAVIKEALRMHPAIAQPLARIVPAGGAELAGHFFPEGTCVGVNSWVLHHNTDIFGPDAAVFRPERWLGPKEEVAVYNENMFSFGAGARTCLGKNVSLLEMNKVIVQIYRKFNIEHVDERNPTNWSTKNMWFVKQNFECRITPLQ